MGFPIDHVHIEKGPSDQLLHTQKKTCHWIGGKPGECDRAEDKSPECFLKEDGFVSIVEIAFGGIVHF